MERKNELNLRENEECIKKFASIQNITFLKNAHKVQMQKVVKIFSLLCMINNLAKIG